MKIARITLKNILGVSEANIQPDGNIIEIKGRNGQGKSSIMQGILDAIGLSSFDTLLRNGEKKGEAIIDCGNLIIRKSHTENGSTLSVKTIDALTDTLSNISSPAKALKKIISPNSADPVRLLTCGKKELSDALLSALPMKTDVAKLSEITNGSICSNIVEDNHALVSIGTLTQQITNYRRDINRDKKAAQISHDQLNATIPEGCKTEEDLLEEITTLKNIVDSGRSLARTAKRKESIKFNGEISASFENIEKMKLSLYKLQAEIKQQEKLHEDLLALSEESCEQAYQEGLDNVSEAEEQIEALYNEKSKISVITNTQSQVDKYSEAVKDLGNKANLASKQLMALSDYKELLCSDLPIKGLELINGELVMNGVPFQTLNTAARVDLVLELAKLSAGKMGIIVLDNAEMMDSETYAEFIEKASKTDLQFVVARVSNENLNVNGVEI